MPSAVRNHECRSVSPHCTAVIGLASIFLSAAVLAAEPGTGKPSPPPGTYLNPIGDPLIHLQEPFVFVYDKKYYLFGTASPSEGFRCYESTDLAHWKLDGWAWQKSGLRVARGDLYAPQVFAYQGMFCMVYRGRTPTGTRLALAACTKPEGPYHDLHVPWLALGDGCTDADVFIEGNRKAFLTFTQNSTQNGCNINAIYGVALSQDLAKTVGQPVKLFEASQRWELGHRDAIRSNAGPRMFKLGSKYYLIYSANDRLTSESGIGYALADKPLGPWTKSIENPLLATHSDIGVVGPGCGSVFRSLDRTQQFLVYESFADPANPSEDWVVNIDRLVLLDNYKIALQGPTRSPQQLPSVAK